LKKLPNFKVSSFSKKKKKKKNKQTPKATKTRHLLKQKRQNTQCGDGEKKGKSQRLMRYLQLNESD
jgi:hypothetical protein